MRYDIVSIGDAFEDVFVEPDLTVKSDARFISGRGICFEFGEKIPLNSVLYEIGGSACNTAVGFSRLGFKASIVTVLGEDTPAQKILDRLQEEDVDTSNLNMSEELQTGFSILFRIDSDRTTFVYHGLKDYSKLRIKKGLRSNWFYVSSLGESTGEIEKRLIEEVAENGSRLAWNPGAKQIEKGAIHFRHLLKCVSILFLNREEALKFVNFSVHPKLEDVIKSLSMLGPKIVVVTNGKEGARCYDGHNFYEAPANLRVQRIDATGAGDAFATGFLGRLLNMDWKKDFEPVDIKEALDCGIKNSSSVIQYIGAQKGLLTNKELYS